MLYAVKVNMVVVGPKAVRVKTLAWRNVAMDWMVVIVALSDTSTEVTWSSTETDTTRMTARKFPLVLWTKVLTSAITPIH